MSIKHIINAQKKDLGDFSVRRVLPSKQQQMVGPWIFFDHMGPVTFSPGTGIDVRPHPHINLATVTYLFEGEIYHRDSLGNSQAIIPGEVNLMVAGKGITHSERERDAIRQVAHPLHGLQLWHALPEQFEEIEPAFYHYENSDIPEFTHNNVHVRLIIGQAYQHQSPVKTFCDTLYFEADLPADSTLALPQSEQLAVYVLSGELLVAQQRISPFTMVIFEDNSDITLQANHDSHIAVIGGSKLSSRHIEWNFVSSRKERIEQAKNDWREQQFATVPGDEREFIPLPK